MSPPSKHEPEIQAEERADPLELSKLPARRTGDLSLLDYVTNGTLSVPRSQKEQKAFFRFLKRASTDRRFGHCFQRMRDAVIRESLARRDKSAGIVVALSGPRGGEGTSFLSLMLSLALGSCTHRRIAMLDGRLNAGRFGLLSEVLSLSKNCVCLQKGGAEVLGFYNESHPNVYFLKNSNDELALEFFSDKGLDAFLDALRRDFDYIVVDAPPLLCDTASVFLAPHVDCLYLVTKSNKTTLTDVHRCVEVVKEAGGKVKGVLVNQQRAPLWARLFWKGFFF